jgi:pyrroline-5-carboxylate reductase
MGSTLCLVGCGAIGSALLEGWLTEEESHKKFTKFQVITPHQDRVAPYLKDNRVEWFESPEDLPSSPAVIVFALKPYQLEDALPLYKSFDSLMISVASGKPLAFYEKLLTAKHKIVRAMPNTPVRIHQGVIGLLAGQHLNAEDLSLAESCFSGLGFCTWLKTDDDINKITALSGSGPAYVFLMMEALAHSAESLSFDKKTALNLALHTFQGACSLAIQSEESPDILRDKVTSPQGTTATALEVFNSFEIKKIFDQAVRKAYMRAKELGE